MYLFLHGEGRFLASLLSGRPVMASLVARTTHTFRSWSSTVAGIWRSVGDSLSSSVLQYKTYSDERLDGRVPPSPSAADPLSGEFSPAVLETYGADRPVYDRNAYGKREGFRVCGSPRVVRTEKLTRTVLHEEEVPVLASSRALRDVAQTSWHDSPKRGFVSDKELIGSACGRGNTHLPGASIMSKEIANLKHRRQRGLSIGWYTFVDILKRCLKQKDLIATRQVHDYIIQSGLQKHPYVANTLLNVYVKCGMLQDAHRVFDGLQRTDRNVITWNVMIGAYAKGGCGMIAYRLFLQMKREGFIPDAFTYVNILNPSASSGALEWVKDVHGHARRAGLESNLRVGTALVHMYAKSGSIDDARLVFGRMEERDVTTWNIMIRAHAESGNIDDARLVFDSMEKRDVITWNTMIGAYTESGNIDDARLVFDRMEKRDVITWTTMIGAYAENGCGMEAYRLFLRMNREGCTPNAFTYTSILNSSASAGALEWVKQVHSHACRAGLESNLHVGTALVHMYAKSGSIDDARLVFDRIEQRDIFTWNTMVGALALHGCGQEALKVFQKMNADCVEPNGTTFVAVLSACSHAGFVDDGRRLFSAMIQDYGIEPTVVHYNCMVDLLGRAGQLEEAKLLIDNMPVEPDGITWRALLGACRTYCNVELGEFAAKEALKLEPENAAVYVLLSNIYAAAGKWEKVGLVRTMMQKRGVRKEPGRSWIEVDNKIHEFSVGDKFHPEAKAIYSELKKLTEQLKAEGYIPDTKVVLHNIDEEEKELALCSHSERLAIAYGLLRVPRGKPIHVQKNLRVCLDCHAATKHISHVTGREIIVRDAIRFHHFKDGVCSCGDYW